MPHAHRALTRFNCQTADAHAGLARRQDKRHRPCSLSRRGGRLPFTFALPIKGSGAPRNAEALRKPPMGGRRSARDTLARRAAPACDRGSAPLGAPPRRLPAPGRASGGHRLMAHTPSASSWRGVLVPPGGARRRPSACSCSSTPAGADPIPTSRSNRFMPLKRDRADIGI
jgi:hypothetical protein